MLFKKFNFIHRFIWISIATIITVSSATRELSLVPLDCDPDLTVIKAKGDNDELYHIWSSTGSFVVLTVRAKLNTDCTCSNATKKIKFDPPQLYSFAIIIHKLVEYGNSNSTLLKIYNFEDLLWKKSVDGFSAYYSLLHNKQLSENSIGIKVTAYGDEDREKLLPRLKHTLNSSLIEIQLDQTPTTFNNSRFGIGFSVVNNNGSDNFEKSSLLSVDDEYTPGIFKMINIVPASKSGDCYFQWKPTVYTTVEHIKESSSITEESSFLNCSTGDIAENSIAYSFYGKNVVEIAQCMEVTFGESSNDFKATNYSSWAFNAGYGIPPEDEISTLVIVVIIVGLGIPVLLLVGGGLYVIIKRCKVKNDDLSLSD